MFEPIFMKHDLAIADKVEAGYLWFWDRFGVPLGPVIFILFVLVFECMTPTMPIWAGILMLGINSVACSIKYFQQAKGQFLAMNRSANTFRGIPVSALRQFHVARICHRRCF